MRWRNPFPIALLAVLAVAGCRASGGQGTPEPAPSRWWKGNLHTHSFWSDGNDYPEMIADWYRRQGYNFLVLSDHNVPPPGEKWVAVPPNPERRELHRRYVERFGPAWVQSRTRGDTPSVRLRTLDEYRPLLEEAGRFLLMPGEEITEYLNGKAVHVTASNLAELVQPGGGESVRGILQNNIDAVLAQRQRAGRPMLVHVNHPNFLWSLKAEELIATRGARFFEVYNGHPLVNNEGDDARPGTERLWDIVLTERLSAGGEVMYGVATDDAHDYHTFEPGQRNPGRGWVMVRAPELTPASVIAAMERGDFYATTGVVLRDIRRRGERLTIEVEPQDDVAYTIQFIGTRRGYDPRTEPVRDAEGRETTPRYSTAVGAVLAEAKGSTAAYTLRGDELYVRAKIVSTRPQANAYREGQVEVAWTQPVVP